MAVLRVMSLQHRYNIKMSTGGGMLFVYFDPIDINVSKWLCMNKFAIYGKERKWRSNGETMFSNAMRSRYLYF